MYNVHVHARNAAYRPTLICYTAKGT